MNTFTDAVPIIKLYHLYLYPLVITVPAHTITDRSLKNHLKINSDINVKIYSESPNVGETCPGYLEPGSFISIHNRINIYMICTAF